VVTFNIPAALVEHYQGRSVVVRSHSPAELADALSGHELPELSYLQLTALPDDVEPLHRGRRGVPVDLVMAEPHLQFPDLYAYAPMTIHRPVRVSVRVVPGFSKAVKVALALHFAVKLEVGQPDSDLVGELLQVADLYLHNSTVSQPVEYFHSLLLAFLHGTPATLWQLQEEEPAQFRYVTEEGVEEAPHRLGSARGERLGSSSAEQIGRDLADEGAECATCPFLAVCCGYFKFPSRDYRCDGISTVFRVLQQAAEELGRDVATFRQAEAGEDV
jgi:hypothetical protein